MYTNNNELYNLELSITQKSQHIISRTSKRTIKHDRRKQYQTDEEFISSLKCKRKQKKPES